MTTQWDDVGGAVDIHAHCVPDAFLVVLREKAGCHDAELDATSSGDPVVTFPDGRKAVVRPELRALPGRLLAMNRAGVSCQVLSPWMEMMPRGLDAASARWWVEAFNDALADVVRSSDGRFEGLGMVTLSEPEAAARQLRDAVVDGGLVGVEIATSIDGARLDDPALDPLWAAAAGTRALVLLHPLAPLGTSAYREARLGDVVGNPAESTVAVVALLLAGVLRRFPDLTVCVVHGGGFLPYQAGRLDMLSQLDAHRWPPGWAEDDLHRLCFDSLTHSDRSLRWLVDFAGADRVLLGSDCPFETGCDDPVGPVARLPDLTTTQRRAILGDNARKLFAAIRR